MNTVFLFDSQRMAWTASRWTTYLTSCSKVEVMMRSQFNVRETSQVGTSWWPLFLCPPPEIPGFKANPDPSLLPLHSDPPSPSTAPSPLHLSPPTPTEAFISPESTVGGPCSGSGRLEDFLESTTGTPLLGIESDGGLALIDDLHSQMLSTPSILDHPPSPMDTSDLGFSPHSAGLDFGDPNLDSMDWLDMVGSASGGSEGNRGERGGGDGGTSLAPLAPHTPQSVFSADFLDNTDLQLHW